MKEVKSLLHVIYIPVGMSSIINKLSKINKIISDYNISVKPIK